METSWRRKRYWENQNGGEQYIFLFRVNMSFWAGLFKVRLSKHSFSENFDFIFVAFQQGVLFILFAHQF